MNYPQTNMERKILFVCNLLILSLLLFTVGCAARALTKPRSEIIQEANDKGQFVPSIEEDREKFFSDIYAHQDRLMSILEKRSQPGARDANYRIGPQDELEINVFDVPELNTTVKVGQSGFISLPLVGGVQTNNLTEAELQKELTRRISSYVKQPQVSVVVSHFGSQKIAVLGAVEKPGTYPLKKGTNSIVELVSEAGGLSSKAGNYINFVPAEISGVSSASDVEGRARFALQTQGGAGTDSKPIEIAIENVMGTSGGVPIEIPVHGGDMIIVPEGGKVLVEGEVTTPGSYELGQRMTLLGALAAASGLTYGANVEEIEVVREMGINEKRHLVLSLEDLSSGKYPDVRLKNGDMVRVPSSSGRRMSQDTFEGITKLINFGIGGSIPLSN